MKQAIRYIIATLVIIIFLFIIRRHADREEDYRSYFLDRDSLSAVINIDRNMYSSKGFPIGFQYQLLNQYSMEQGCDMKITSSFYEEDCWQQLIDGKVDIIAVENQDSIPEQFLSQIQRSIPMKDYYWAVRSDEVTLLDNVNIWISFFKQKKEYRTLENQFFRSYKLDNYLENMGVTKYLSPYDDIIKRQSRILGWDWRLLASIIYNESRFSMNVHSKRGAVGLMQVIPSTAKTFGVSDVYNPEENVHAGVLYLKYLKKIFEGQGIDSTNVVKFCLASYNAGEGRIQDCMDFTYRQGEDHRDWEAVSRAIPLMKDADAESLRFGKFNGTETIKYVDAVLTRFEEYLFVVNP